MEGTDSALNQKTYFNRIKQIVEKADELVAFHVNKSHGTQYTIELAKKKGIPVKIFSYSIWICGTIPVIRLWLSI